MHLNIGLPQLSELEQLSRGFWMNHNHQNQTRNQNKSPDSHEQTQCSQTQRHSPDAKLHSDNANNHTEPNHLTESQNLNSTPERHSDEEHDNHEMRPEDNHSCLSRQCKDHSQEKSKTCCKSTSVDSGENGSKSSERNNPSGQPEVQEEPSQQLQVNTSLGRSNRQRRTCRVLWDRSEEDSAFL